MVGIILLVQLHKGKILLPTLLPRPLENTLRRELYTLRLEVCVVVLIAQVLTTNLAEDSTPAEEFTRACLAHSLRVHSCEVLVIELGMRLAPPSPSALSLPHLA